MSEPSSFAGLAINETRRVRLRPLRGDDYPELFALEADPEVLHTWRLRGGVPADMAAYEHGLWFGVADQRIIEGRQSGAILGLVQMYNIDFRLGVGWFSVISVPSARRSGVVMEGTGLFLLRCFRTWGLRRIYFSALEPNFPQFSSVVGRAGCSIYGTMRQRTYLAGSPVDVIYGGVDAEPWLAHYEPILQRLSG